MLGQPLAALEREEVPADERRPAIPLRDGATLLGRWSPLICPSP